MSNVQSDPLLTSARALVTIGKVLLTIGYVVAGFCALVSVIGHGSVVSQVLSSGAPPIAAWGVSGLLALVCVVLLLGERFVRRLREIIDSVGARDSFAPVNADRLEQMGWLALAMDLVAIPTGALAQWLSPLVKGVTTDIQFSPASLVLILVLFILARVFRQGAAMRDELEGTV